MPFFTAFVSGSVRVCVCVCERERECVCWGWGRWGVVLADVSTFFQGH